MASLQAFVMLVVCLLLYTSPTINCQAPLSSLVVYSPNGTLNNSIISWYSTISLPPSSAINGNILLLSRTNFTSNCQLLDNSVVAGKLVVYLSGWSTAEIQVFRDCITDDKAAKVKLAQLVQQWNGSGLICIADDKVFNCEK